MAHNASYPQPLTYLDDPINPNPDTLVVDYSTLWPSKDPFSPPDNHPSPESFIPQAYQNYGGSLFDEGESAISQAQGQNRSTMPFHSVEANGPLDEPNQSSSSEHSISYSFASQYGADLFAHFPHDLVRVDTFRAFSTDNYLNALLPYVQPESRYACMEGTDSGPSPGSFVPPTQVDSMVVATLRDDFRQYLGHNLRLHDTACSIAKQSWCRWNDPEPPLDKENDSHLSQLLAVIDLRSRFDLFFDDNDGYQCLWGDGVNRCPHRTSRRDRALGHAHAHFQYRPFSCQERCGKKGCIDRYSCVTSLKEHIRRRKKPLKSCVICNRTLAVQNLSRHMKRHLTEDA